MIKNYQGVIALTSLLFANGCANIMPTPVASTPDPRPCASNFAVDGSALSLSGKKYSTTMFVAGGSMKTAMDRASKQIALEGMTITTLDREGGLITASNKVTAGNGDTVPLVATIEAQKGGVNIQMKFSTGFGQVTTDDYVKDFFCKVISAVEKK